MVPITIVNGVYKPTSNWGAPLCRFFQYFSITDCRGTSWPFALTLLDDANADVVSFNAALAVAGVAAWWQAMCHWSQKSGGKPWENHGKTHGKTMER